MNIRYRVFEGHTDAPFYHLIVDDKPSKAYVFCRKGRYGIATLSGVTVDPYFKTKESAAEAATRLQLI